ncbi:MAG: SDR family oxidoreductase [Siphonobacter sp.]
MNLNLIGKTAVVCGSTQGLGWASAYELSTLGATVILLARNEDKLKLKVLELDTSFNQKHSYLVADFSFPEQVKAVISQINAPVHLLVNNTGGPAAGNVLDAPAELFLSAFTNHIICNQTLVQAFVAGMKAEGYGRIINIISTSVKTPLPGLGVSNTIRGAVANWSKTLANELGPFGITVNNVLPGYMATSRLDSILEQKAKTTQKSIQTLKEEMIEDIPVGRIGNPTEFGATVAFLCSPAAAYINGINLPVDGGRLACL